MADQPEKTKLSHGSESSVPATESAAEPVTPTAPKAADATQAKSDVAATPVRENLKKFLPAAIPIIGIGVLIGMFIPQNGIRLVVTEWLMPAEATEEEEADNEGEDTGIFEVSVAAQKTYGLEIAKAKPGTYTQHVRVPAFVRERPTVSNLRPASRLQGVVRRIFVQVGQSVREGDPLVELELTGDELASAQAILLDSVQSLSIITDEIKRLRPAAEDGGIARKNLIEKEYEERRVKSLLESKRQELLVRGLSPDDVSGIIRDKQLVRTMTLRVPSGIRPQNVDSTTTLQPDSDRRFRLVSKSDENDAAGEEPDEWVYSVEAMNVSPGSVVAAGESLCDLAYHETLLIEGQAWERDLPLLTKIIDEQQTVSISVGDSDAPTVIDGLNILFMDNHVDNETQTYRFYIEVPNSVLTENKVGDKRRFRTWKFKPGQRGHVQLPQKKWEDQLVLPADAVAEDGVDHVIFHHVALHNHFHGSEPPHSEFKGIVVKVLYKDQHTVVADHDGQLKERHSIAMNNADMLLRAKNEGGGGHAHHHHEH